ncbi:MAG: bacteriohemerythrin [Ignavibacteria bacterium]|jgi:hemerythrin-like metal-binding protein
MALIVWGDNFSVKNSLIDYQHKRLVNLVNELHNSMKEGKGKDALGKTFYELINYTKEHFDTEEKLMQKANFPDYAAHKKEHDTLTKEVLNLKEKFDAGKAMISIEVLNFLKNWLTVHILDTDKQYTDYI